MTGSKGRVSKIRINRAFVLRSEDRWVRAFLSTL